MAAAPVENGKAPANGTYRNNEISSTIRVQPPRREDLQPAYAQTLQGESEDAATHGWYGSMSMSIHRLHIPRFATSAETSEICQS